MAAPFLVTWETLTAESVAVGDAAARGFVLPRPWGFCNGPLRLPGPMDADMPLRRALAALTSPESAGADLESIEASDSDHGAAHWIVAHYRATDGATIGESRALHFPETLTPASRARLVRLICNT